jgi:hypothetical protein
MSLHHFEEISRFSFLYLDLFIHRLLVTTASLPDKSRVFIAMPSTGVTKTIVFAALYFRDLNLCTHFA